MSYQTFTSIEELLEHVKNNVKKTDDKFAVGESVDFFEQLEKKTSDHKKSITEKEALEKRAREAEAKVKDVEPKIAEYQAEIEHLKLTNPPNEKIVELSEKLKKEAAARTALESKNAELVEQVGKLGELQQQVSDMTAREHRQIIIGKIRSEGNELKIPQSILNDDVWLERLFVQDLKYDPDSKKVFAENDVSVKNYLLSKQKEKPELLAPRSNGAGGGPGQPQGTGGTQLSLGESFLPS